jgi:hypothetical protein
MLITVCDCVRCAVCGVRCAVCGRPAFKFMQCAAVCGRAHSCVQQCGSVRGSVRGSVCGNFSCLAVRAAVCGCPAVRQCAAVWQ